MMSSDGQGRRELLPSSFIFLGRFVGNGVTCGLTEALDGVCRSIE
jgi:hypothetical protein